MSTRVTIPGGTADLFADEELTPRRKRPLERLMYRSPGLMGKIQTAATIFSVDGDESDASDLPGGDFHLTAEDADIMAQYQDAAIWARLKSWTLDAPLPEDVDAVLDIQPDVYDALAREIANLDKDASPEQFEPTDESLEDDQSPTGS